MNLDEIDIKILKENFSEEDIKKMNIENVSKIFRYLSENDVYYAKDLFLSSFNLFLLPYDEFVKRFEILKQKLGNEYVDKLGEDSSLIEIMYEI